MLTVQGFDHLVLRCLDVETTLGGDKVQTETKQINVWFKIPDTSMEATVGIHGVGDSYSGVFGATNDVAGVTIKGKYEPVDYKFVFAKLYENDTHESDDATLADGLARALAVG